MLKELSFNVWCGLPFCFLVVFSIENFLDFCRCTPLFCSSILIVVVQFTSFTRVPEIFFYFNYVHVGTAEITDLCSGGCVISGRKDQTMYMLAERQANL